jgi:hypothetical protein
MEHQFKEMKLLERVTFVNAISADTLGNFNIIDSLSETESANLFSHLKALHHFINSDKEFAVIMEDDCNIENAKKFKNTLAQSFVKSKIKNICIQLMVNVREEDLLACELNKRTFWEFSTVAYFIDREYAALIIKKFNTVKKINNYPQIEIFDPRNKKTFYRKRTTETIIYSENSYSIPIFTSKVFSASIKHLNKEEAIRQEVASAEKTNSLWLNQKEVDFFEYLSKIKIFDLLDNFKKTEQLYED